MFYLMSYRSGRSILKNSVSEACRMEEAFWKIWYGKDEILLGTSFVTTGFSSLSFLFSGAMSTSLLFKRCALCVFCLSISFCFIYFCINHVDSAERHYKNGLRFLNGEDGFSINYDIAMTAFERAGECGHAQAYRHLGEMKMARDDDFAAIKAWDKAVKMGDVASARLLGDFYETTSVELPATLRKELIYISYFLGGCLGDEELRRKAERLRFVVSPETREDAASLCAEISRSKGR